MYLKINERGIINLRKLNYFENFCENYLNSELKHTLLLLNDLLTFAKSTKEISIQDFNENFVLDNFDNLVSDLTQFSEKMKNFKSVIVMIFDKISFLETSFINSLLDFTIFENNEKKSNFNVLELKEMLKNFYTKVCLVVKNSLTKVLSKNSNHKIIFMISYFLFTNNIEIITK